MHEELAMDPFVEDSMDPLVDTFGRRHTYLRISLTERCNLRCVYCMPEEGVALSPRGDILTFEEIERLARLFVRLGVDKIRLTGGEPLVRKQVEDLALRLGHLPGLRTLALTTNGFLLKEKMDALIAARLQQVNISLDTLRPERFRRITRRDGLERVLEAIDLALERGISSVKVNCVLMKGENDDEIGDFVDLTRDRPLDVRFIEYMPFAGNGWNVDAMLSYREILARLEQTHGRLVAQGDEPHATARTYRVPGAAGTVGFIASMSDAFCGTCNRLRLTADGHLKVCLFGVAEVSLRDAMRSGSDDGELARIIGEAVRRKRAAHDGMLDIPVLQNRPMILIGG